MIIYFLNIKIFFKRSLKMDNNSNYLLCFNNFEENIKRSWQELQNKNEFYDVTLACEDGQIKAHQIIIS